MGSTSLVYIPTYHLETPTALPTIHQPHELTASWPSPHTPDFIFYIGAYSQTCRTVSQEQGHSLPGNGNGNGNAIAWPLRKSCQSPSFSFTVPWQRGVDCMASPNQGSFRVTRQRYTAGGLQPPLAGHSAPCQQQYKQWEDKDTEPNHHRHAAPIRAKIVHPASLSRTPLTRHYINLRCTADIPAKNPAANPTRKKDILLLQWRTAASTQSCIHPSSSLALLLLSVLSLDSPRISKAFESARGPLRISHDATSLSHPLPHLILNLSPSTRANPLSLTLLWTTRACANPPPPTP